MNPPQQPDQRSYVTNSTYHQYIRTLHTKFPHLESLSLYSRECEKGRVAGKLGSRDSNSILVAEKLMSTGDVGLHRINCYDNDDLERYREVLTGIGNTSAIHSRVLIIEDLSPAAIEILGASLNLDPRVFYFHLGFDTRRSAMVDLIDEIPSLLLGVCHPTPPRTSSASHCPAI